MDMTSSALYVFECRVGCATSRRVCSSDYVMGTLRIEVEEIICESEFKRMSSSGEL